MNNPVNYLYDIEMPPADISAYLWWLLGFLIIVLLLLILLRVFQWRQPEALALQELKHLSSLNPYQLASLLRAGLQETQLQKVLPDALLKDLELSRYAVAPDVDMKRLFQQAEVFLQDKTKQLSTWLLFKRLLNSVASLPLRAKLQPVKGYVVFVIDDFTRFVKSLWSRFHGRS